MLQTLESSDFIQQAAWEEKMRVWQFFSTTIGSPAKKCF